MRTGLHALSESLRTKHALVFCDFDMQENIFKAMHTVKSIRKRQRHTNADEAGHFGMIFDKRECVRMKKDVRLMRAAGAYLTQTHAYGQAPSPAHTHRKRERRTHRGP